MIWLICAFDIKLWNGSGGWWWWYGITRTQLTRNPTIPYGTYSCRCMACILCYDFFFNLTSFYNDSARRSFSVQIVACTNCVFFMLQKHRGYVCMRNSASDSTDGLGGEGVLTAVLPGHEHRCTNRLQIWEILVWFVRKPIGHECVWLIQSDLTWNNPDNHAW